MAQPFVERFERRLRVSGERVVLPGEQAAEAFVGELARPSGANFAGTGGGGCQTGPTETETRSPIATGRKSSTSALSGPRPSEASPTQA